MAPMLDASTLSPTFQGKSEIIERDGSQILRLYHPVDKSVPARQIAIRPSEDKLLIFKVGSAAEPLKHELLDTVQLPESVDPFTVEARINGEGVLEVEIPLIQKDDGKEEEEEDLSKA